MEKTIEQIKQDKQKMDEAIKSAVREFIDANPDVKLTIEGISVKTSGIAYGHEIVLAIIVESRVEL